jgi:hypothetical protein
MNRERLQQLLNELNDLLAAAGARQQAKAFDILLPDAGSPNEKELIRYLRSHFAGAGSLHDLVLHRDSKPLQEENNRLDTLRTELFEQIKLYYDGK